MSRSAADLRGVIAALVTPFDGQDRLDEKAARRIARYVIEGGADGIMTAGGTGEFPHLSREERRQMTRVVAEEAGGKIPVIAGTAACSTREAIELTLDAAHAGASAAILTPPFYFRLAGRALFDHFAAVARASPIPIVVYNNPLYTGNPLPPPLLAELAQVENIIGLKQSETDLGQLVEAIRRAGDRISILTGIDSQFYAALCAGARGINQYFEYDPGYVAPCKEALAMLGLDAGRARSPLPGLTNEERAGIRGALRELGYKVPSS
jgi:4-hydroxy-tetrahydrodipicolinate synthase